MPRDLSKPPQSVAFTVLRLEDGMRLDAWLPLRVTWRSRADIQRRIERGAVRVNGMVRRKSWRVRTKDRVEILVDGPASIPTPMDEIPIRILFEDAWIIALDKAPGTVVHPAGRHVNDTIVSALHVRHSRTPGASGAPPMIVHRLDQDTSGVLVLAKDGEVRKILGAAFESRRVEKTYLAIAAGRIEPDEFSIDLPIGPAPEGTSKVAMACTADGRPSRTGVQVIERHARYTLVRCRPLTGRQHQIRVHLAAAGHPLLCDPLYGDPGPLTAGDLSDDHPDPGAVILDRLALHGESLRFRHPATGEPVALYAPVPRDLARLPDALPGPPPGISNPE